MGSNKDCNVVFVFSFQSLCHRHVDGRTSRSSIGASSDTQIPFSGDVPKVKHHDVDTNLGCAGGVLNVAWNVFESSSIHRLMISCSPLWIFPVLGFRWVW